MVWDSEANFENGPERKHFDKTFYLLGLIVLACTGLLAFGWIRYFKKSRIPKTSEMIEKTVITPPVYETLDAPEGYSVECRLVRTYKTSNRKRRLVYMAEYDQFGYRTDYTEYSDDGKAQKKRDMTEHQTDEFGRLIEVRIYDPETERYEGVYRYEYTDEGYIYCGYDWKDTLIEEIRYDNDDNIVGSITITGAGRIEMTVDGNTQIHRIVYPEGETIRRFTYSDDGELLKVEQKDPDGVEWDYFKTTLSSDGLPIKETYFQRETSADGDKDVKVSVFQMAEYDYDHGAKTKRTYMNSDGLKLRMKEEWDAKGNLVKTIEYDPDSELGSRPLSTVIYEYDDAGHMTLHLEKDFNGEELEYREEAYDEQGRLIKSLQKYSGYFIYWYEREYIDSENLVRETHKNQNGDILYYTDQKKVTDSSGMTTESLMNYNADGSVYNSDSGSSGTVSKYDSFGNWLCYIVYENGVPAYMYEYEYKPYIVWGKTYIYPVNYEKSDYWPE